MAKTEIMLILKKIKNFFRIKQENVTWMANRYLDESFAGDLGN